MNFSGTVKLNPVGVFVLLGLTFIFFVYSFAGKKTNEREVNLKNVLIAAVNAAIKGGDEIKVFNTVDINKRSKGKTKEGANDFITDADVRSHCVMYYGLRYMFPFIKVISEETPQSDVCEKYYQKLSLNADDANINALNDVYVPIDDITIWIDPLDATQEFTEQLREYVTTMVCVAVKGKPLIGVIHQPFSKQSITSWSWLGNGISNNLQQKNKVKVDTTNPKIIVSRSHSGEVKKIIKHAIPTAEVVTAGGAGYKILQLINGNVSAYIHMTAIKKWDICSGNAILNSVGGHLSTFSGKDINYADGNDSVIKNGILAALLNHEWFYQKLKSYVPT